MVIILWGQFFNLVQAEARNKREVMVGHVDSHMIRYQVEGPAVSESLIRVEFFAALFSSLFDRSHSGCMRPPRAAEVGVVLGDEVTSTRMKPQAKKRGTEQIQNTQRPREPVKNTQENDLGNNVQKVLVSRRLGVDNERSNSVEEGLK